MLRPFMFIFLLLSLVCITANAAVVNDLYRARVQVQNQSNKEQQRAILIGLQEVLIKITGSDVGRAQSQLLKNAAQFVQQYSYETDESNDQRLWISLEFDKRQLNQSLNQAKQAVWGRDRPLIMMWVAESKNNQLNLLGVDSRHRLVKQLNKSANLHGMPVVWPVLDLTDLRQLDAEDIWTENFKAVQNASRRYAPDAILLGKVQQIGSDNWQTHWVLLDNYGKHIWRQSSLNFSDIPPVTFSALAEYMVKRYALVDGANKLQQLRLTVQGVHSAKAFAELNTYLGGLNAVQHVSVNGVAADEVTFDIAYAGNLPALTQTLALGRSLLEDKAKQALAGDDAQPHLYYRFLPK